jgi:hypothetical protein
MRHYFTGATLVHGPQVRNVPEVEIVVNAEPDADVFGELHQIAVSCALSEAKHRALNALRACHQRELSGGNRRAAVVVWVHTQNDAISVLQTA